MSEADRSSEQVTYLVNGLPSLLARRVLEQVLCFEPRARVLSVVHADDLDHVERLLGALDDSQRTRVELYTGELTAIDFGLSGPEYLSLCRRVSRVHHVVSPSSIYVDAMNQAEVGAALGREIIEFSRAATLSVCVVYSSAAVSGNRTGSVLETELVEGQQFLDPFSQALALMELVIRRALPELPAIVVRPTLLSADSQTGECERTSPLYRLTELVVDLPETQVVRVPTDKSPLHLVAVDYVARAAYYVGRRADTLGSTLHFGDTHPTTLSHVIELLLDAAGHSRRDRVTVPRLQQPISDFGRAVAALRGPNVFYDARNAARVLDGSGIGCPAFREYADKLVSYVRSKRGQRGS